MIERYLGIFALAFILGFGGAWTAQHWRYTAKISAIEKKQADALAKAHQKNELLYQRISDADSAHTKALKEKNDEITSLSDDVAAGLIRLRVNARCPAMPEAAASSGMGNGSSPRLNAAAERDYFTLRRGIEQVTAQLSACQQILRIERE